MIDTPPSQTRILIVEDETVVAMDIQQRLENSGYLVVGRAISGEQAAQFAIKDLPDLILMDIQLKGEMDGICAAEQIRACADIPVVFLTAYSDEATLQRARQIEPFGYILKPFEERELIVHIEMALYKHRMEKALRQSQERYQLAVMGSNDGIWDWNLNSGEFYISPRWKHILGYEDSQINNELPEWFHRVHADDIDRLQAELTNHIQGASRQIEIEYRMQRQDGSWIWVLTRGLGLRDSSGRAYRLSGSQTDITPLKLAEERRLQDALYDSLTGLPTRSLLLDRVGYLLNKKSNQVVLFYIDLDNFRSFNESLGYANADRILSVTANRLSEMFDDANTIARLNGDSFCIVRESLSLAQAQQCAAEIIAAFHLPLPAGGENLILLSVSVGVALSQPSCKAETLLHQGEIALFQAKASGKANWAIFDPQYHQRTTERMNMENDLRKAMELQEFFIAYQPILSLPDRRIIGFEALMRWHPSGKDPVPPDEFIPLAEEIGLIIPLGEWVLRQSCRQLQTWNQQYQQRQPLQLNVNLSARQFSHPQLIETISQILEETGMQSSCLNLEITESTLLADWEQSNQLIERLNQMGIGVHLDDFGTGYSSLSYLQRLAVQGIKLDRSFILSLETPPNLLNGRGEVIRTIFTLARSLGMNIVAEGVETSEQLNHLLDLDCDQVQGFLFHKPMFPAQVEQTCFVPSIVK